MDVLPNHRFDESALLDYLAAELPGFAGPVEIRQFQGGQSNPTYHLEAKSGSYVLRKKPAGKLLPSAHAVDREFRVISALQASPIPVPRAHLLCSDESVIGQMFYIMDYVDGRVFTDRLLPGCAPDERSAMYDDMNRVLAALHRLDADAIGLAEFGRSKNYAQSQITRWKAQYLATKLFDVPALDEVVAWLEANAPEPQAPKLIHGDFRIGNLIYHATEPRVVAVLDWELATLGHPLADLAYNCLAYHLPYLGGRGFGEADLRQLGIPGEGTYLADYAHRMGWERISDWTYFLVLSLFRTAAIQIGVHRRASEGNASSVQSIGPETYLPIAEAAARLARSAVA